MSKKWSKVLCSVMIVCILCSNSFVLTGRAASGQVITISGDGQVLDSFNGVNAVYRQGSWDGTDNTYGCHAYVIRYYQAVYGKSVYNLFHAQTPLTYGDTFVQVSSPQPGDICAQIKSTTNHWSIVKSVNGSSVTVIDQNNKWVAGGVTYAYKNFTYDASEVVFYRLASLAGGQISSETVVTQQQNTATEAPKQEKPANTVSSTSVNCGTDKEITKSQAPALANGVSFTWTSSNAQIASVSSEGIITGVNKGSCEIIGNGSDGSTATIKVSVKIPAQKLKLGSKDVTLPKSYKWKMKTVVTPSNSTDKLTFNSSNKKVATVSKKGLVKSKRKKGRTTITVKTSSGQKKKCIVRVH